MIAPKVTNGACDLKPKSIQMFEMQYWVIRAHDVQDILVSAPPGGYLRPSPLQTGQTYFAYGFLAEGRKAARGGRDLRALVNQAAA
jgi:hypothetical protein